MPAFRQVLAYCGVDEHTATGNVGIVVPLRGSNVVILADGPTLHVESTVRPAVQVEEITDPRTHPIWSKLIAATLSFENLKARAIRVFKVSANSLVGIDVAKVVAKNDRPSRVEATLKVLVVKQKLIKISIRPTQVRDGPRNIVGFTNSNASAQSLLDQMNLVWEPQANIVFQLARTDPALIDGLSPTSAGADIQNSAMAASFKSNKDPAADLTVFLVRRAFDGAIPVSGVTDAKAGFALIGDNRSETTLAHEAGHFLGALNEHGKFSQRYGHQGTDPDLLMRDGGAGRKIPYGLVTDFNKGYRGVAT